jgi:hypothetical protein
MFRHSLSSLLYVVTVVVELVPDDVDPGVVAQLPVYEDPGDVATVGVLG